jgi:hypothetical protein
MAAVSVIPVVLDYFEDEIVRAEILPKTRTVYEQNGSDVKIVLAVLACVSKILDKLDRSAIIDEVLPLLFEVKLQDVNVLVRVLGKKLYYIQKEENSTLELQFKLTQWYYGNRICGFNSVTSFQSWYLVCKFCSYILQN